MLSRLFVKSRGLPLLALACLGFSNSAHAGFEWYPPASDDQSGMSNTSPPSPIMMPSLPSPGAAPVIISGSPGPATNPTYAPAPAYAPTPSDAQHTSAPEPLTPVIVTGTASQAKPSPASTYTPASSYASAPSYAPTPVYTPPAATPSAPPTSSASSDIPIYNGPVPDDGPMHPANLPVTVQNVPSSSVTEKSTTSVVAETTSPSNSSDVVHGFARSVPVVVALRQILPPGFTFSIDQSVDMGTLVSFKGGRPWRDTLHDALVPVGLKMTEQGQMVQISYASDTSTAAANTSPSYQPGQEPHGLGANDNVPTMDVATPAVAPSAGMSAAAANPPEAVVETWTADRGSSLHKIMTDWCARAHTELNWLAEYDYPLEASVNFTGTFPEAVRSLLTGFEGAHPQPVAELHANTSIGQMVLVVQARGNTNTD